MIIDNSSNYKKIAQGLEELKGIEKNEIVKELFTKDFSTRFCWSSNAIEGNTLSLDDTVALIEDDIVRDGHSFTEYQEAKNLHKAISNNLIPFHKELITEDWIKRSQGIIMDSDGEYRKGPVYVGSLVEAVFFPPEHVLVPELMARFFEMVNFKEKDVEKILEKAAKSHLSFERIHPFPDGNGRVGRMILNQQLINNGLFPVVINPKGKYRRSFRTYDRNGDMSELIHELCKAELSSIEMIKEIGQKMKQDFSLEPAELDERIDDARTRTEIGSSVGPKKKELNR